MVLHDSRPLKRAKRRINADFNDFLAFPPSPSTGTGEPFRDGVRSFVARHARSSFTPSVFPALEAWHILLRVGDHVVDVGPDSQRAVVALDIIEEDVARSNRAIHCDQCRVVGWGSHPVCRKRYHFIIRADSGPHEGYQKSCSMCGHMLQFSESRCNSCNSMVRTDDLEDWVYRQFDNNTHLLHGVVHSNGYGHLLRVNGREGGSKVLSGCDIMNFWDRLCQALAVRKVSVMDVSKKYGMEYRLLNAVTKGYSWYGKWGYEFGSGSYGLTPEAYQEAIHTLSSMPISPFLFHGRRPQSQLQAVIAFYKSLSVSELLTMKDLFSFLLNLIQSAHKSSASATSKMSESKSLPSNVLCVWTSEDIERVQQSMVKVLRVAASGASWVSWHALKCSICKLASPELINYCLKHFGGKLTMDGNVVRARFNPNHGGFEFRLEQPSVVHSTTESDSSCPSEQHIIKDLKFLYESLLNRETVMRCGPQNMREHVFDATTKLVDCKHFVKDYKPDKMAIKNPSVLCYWCHAEPLDKSKTGPSAPSELIVLPLNATFADFKSEAATIFQEVYALFKRFVPEELPGYGFIEDSFPLKLLFGLSGSIRIRGKCPANYVLNRFRLERGIENWTVDCICGAKDDDGERMLACDTCSVWQHTRCAGIAISDSIPDKFVCWRCDDSGFKESKKVSYYRKQINKRPSLHTACRAVPICKEHVCVSWDNSCCKESEKVSDTFKEANCDSTSDLICAKITSSDPITAKVVCTTNSACKVTTKGLDLSEETSSISSSHKSCSSTISDNSDCKEFKITLASCSEPDLVSAPAMMCRQIASSDSTPRMISTVVPPLYKKASLVHPLRPTGKDNATSDSFMSKIIDTRSANSCSKEASKVSLRRRSCKGDAMISEKRRVRTGWGMKFDAMIVK